MNTIDSLFTWFLAATIRASLLALAVLALQAALRQRLAARWRYALWLPVVLVLVAPQLPQSRWSAENYVVLKAAPAAPTAEPLVSAAVPAPGEKSEGTAFVTKAAPAMGWRQLAGGTWLAGTGILLLVGLVSYARTMRRMQRGEIPASASVRDGLAEAAAACGLRRAPRLLVSTAVTSPAVTGLLRPVLLLPAEMQTEFSREELHHVLAHECTHLRRLDVAGNWLLCLLQALHWCNPLLWLAFARIPLDREAACDEQVLAGCSGEERAGYGHVLLRLAGAPRQPGFAVGWVGIFGPGAAIRSRIVAIADDRHWHAGWKVLSLALVAGLMVAGATRAPQALAAEDKAPQILIEARIMSVIHNPDVPIDIEGEKLGTSGNAAIAVQRSDSFKKLMAQFAPEKGGTLLSAPRVLTRDGMQAMIEVGEEAPKQEGAERRFVGYTLKVTPRIKRAALMLEFTVTMNRAIDTETGEPLAGPIKDWSRVKIETQEATATESLEAGQSISIYEPRTSAKQPALVIGLTPTVMPAGGLPAPAAAVPAEAKAPSLPGLPRVAEKVAAEAPPLAGPAAKLVAGADAGAKTAAIILPVFTLKEASLLEAVKYLSEEAKKADPEHKGVTFVLAPGTNADARITLMLSDVPVLEALKYITNLANSKYRIEGERIVISPLPPR